MNIEDVHVSHEYLWGHENEHVIVLTKNEHKGTALVEFQSDMKLRSVVAEQLRPVKVSVASAFKKQRKLKPIDTVESKELSAADDIKNALSKIANDIADDETDESDDDGYGDQFKDESDFAASHDDWEQDKVAELSELLSELGFDMSMVELRSNPITVTFHDHAAGYLWGMLAGVWAGEEE